MKKTVLTFGLISGAIMTAMMFGTLPFTNSAWLQAHSMVIGYTTMVLSFMLVFFGIRSYRENIGGGTITFGRAFAVGILITLHPHLICFVCNHMGDHVLRYSQLW